MLFKELRIPLVCTLSLTHQAAAIETVHRVIVCSVISATERTGPVLFTPPKRTRTTSHYHPNDCRYEMIVQQNFSTIVTIGKGETLQNCARCSDEPVSSHRKLLGVSHFPASFRFFASLLPPIRLQHSRRIQMNFVGMEYLVHFEFILSELGLAAAATRAWSSLESLGAHVNQVPSIEHIHWVWTETCSILIMSCVQVEPWSFEA